MRPRLNNQPQFHFQDAPTLKIAPCNYGKYDRIDASFTGHPELVDLIHRDIAEPLDCEKAPDPTGEECYKCSSETLMLSVTCQIIEGCSRGDRAIFILNCSNRRPAIKRAGRLTRPQGNLTLGITPLRERSSFTAPGIGNASGSDQGHFVAVIRVRGRRWPGRCDSWA